MKTYTVYYWSGGREVGKWNLCAPYGDKASVLEMQASLAKLGYVSHYAETKTLTAIGLPDGPPCDAEFKALGL